MKEQDYDIKKEYNKLKEKYNLPTFEELSQDFDIEKLQDKETSFLAREIRRTINEKITAYVHLFETLINPQGPPMFIFKILKNIKPEEKESIQKFYKELSKIEIEVMKLDTIYQEKKEAKFIKNIFEIWQKMKKEIHILFEAFESNFENGETSQGRSYFD